MRIEHVNGIVLRDSDGNPVTTLSDFSVTFGKVTFSFKNGMLNVNRSINEFILNGEVIVSNPVGTRKMRQPKI